MSTNGSTTKEQAKIAAYTEMMEEADKAIDDTNLKMSTVRGISAGFKLSAELTLNQMRAVQNKIDEGEIDMDVAKLVITELSQLSKVISDNGRKHELDCARLDGHVKQAQAQKTAAQQAINKLKRKVELDEARDDRRGTRALRDGEAAEVAPGDNGKPKAPKAPAKKKAAKKVAKKATPQRAKS